MLRSLTLALLVLLVAPVASASTFLSESQGDRYRYVDGGTGRVVHSAIRLERGNWRLWENFAGFGNRWVYTYPGATSEWFWVDAAAGPQLMPRLDGPAGRATTPNLTPLNGRCGVSQVGATLVTAAGAFNDVTRLDFTTSAGGGGVQTVWIARGVGIVRWVETTTLGVLDFELVEATVGGVHYGPPPPLPTPAPPPPSPGPSARPTAVLYGEDLGVSDVIYVLDRGGSMGWDVQSYTDPSGAVRQGDRLTRATAELVRSIMSLSPVNRFNVVAFDCATSSWSQGLQDATDANKQAAISWLMNIVPGGGTGTGPAVSLALQDRDAEGIALVTDGAPNCGATGPSGHGAMIRAANVGSVPIHCFGIAASGSYRAFLQGVANDSRGSYFDVP